MKIGVILKYILTVNNILEKPLNLSGINNHIYHIESNSEFVIQNRELNKNKLELNFNNVYNMFLMSYNAYYDIDDTNWNNIPYDADIPIEDDSKLKGYIFSNDDNTLNFIAFKGTTLFSFKNGTSTYNDRFNDNLFYSCCFYKESSIFNRYINRSECEDALLSKPETCFKDCYKTNFDIHYLDNSKRIIEKFKKKKLLDFDNTEIIFTGHSLGGITATFLGLEYKRMAVTYQTPGSKHYFEQIDYDISKGWEKIYNFGHSADAIMNANCGVLCWLFGYNINTKCHVGYDCIYDSINKMGISESINTHRLSYVNSYIIPKWEHDMPKCVLEAENCRESNCENWVYIPKSG